MRRIVIDMQNYLYADAVAQALKNANSDFDIYRAEREDQVPSLCRLTSPFALLMEVVGFDRLGVEQRLEIRDEVKRYAPECKVVLIVDEKAHRLTEQVKQAKKDGLIDQFIFGSTSSAYLSALVDTL